MNKPVAYKTVFYLLGVVWLMPAMAQVMSTREYIDQYKYAAMQEMKVYRIPASITLGQGILESASGNSRLARDCNNHFGIKCRKNWTGTFCLADDDAPNECFRGYPSAAESYRDHSLFLTQNSRYAGLFTYAITDYNAWANGLRNAGYATNPAYANTLIGVIQKYRLGMYDSMVLLGDDYMAPDTAAQRIVSVNGLPAVYAAKGETPEDIAKRQEMGPWQIYKYNDLKKGDPLNPGEIVYLKPKRRKGSVASVTVKEGESLRQISQEYGIKMKHLNRKNLLKPGQQVKAGEVLYLQKKRETAPAVTGGTSATTAVSATTETGTAGTGKVIQNENFHEVQPGETLYGISRARNVAVSDLIRWNNLDSGSLKSGQILVLKPGVKSMNNTPNTEGTEAELKTSLTTHTVMPGETLYAISRLYNSSVDSIMAWNHLKDPVIRKGMELKVTAPGKAGKASAPGTYTVQTGDTLYSISRRFGVSVQQIKSLNGLTSDTLTRGKILKMN
ncbi:MAG: LysM peptidoglycan-binding domain-containing protein [Bacteroidetes bacterium]|nr:LysM peptidoglycan-binding domain-containing protein [Bacteroidota bacterium]